MKKFVLSLLCALTLSGCEYKESEKYEMVLTYAIHFQDGVCSRYDYVFIGNEKAQARIRTSGTFTKKLEYLYISRLGYNSIAQEVCQTTGQLEIISIKRKEDSHE